MQFWGKDHLSDHKSKDTKIPADWVAAGAFNRDAMGIIEYPNPTNAAVWLGSNEFYTAKWGRDTRLVGIDIDCHGKPLTEADRDSILLFFPQTLTERTGSGGIHLYYVITGTWTRSAHDKLPPNKSLHQMGVDMVEVLTNNQIFFCAGSKFIEHADAYTVLTAMEPLEMNVTDLERIIGLATDASPPPSSPMRRPEIPVSSTDDRVTGVDDMLRTELAQMIVATGIIPIEEGHTRHNQILALTLLLKYMHCDEESTRVIIQDVAQRVGSTESDDQIESEISDMYNGRGGRQYSSSYKFRDEFQQLAMKTPWKRSK
jgi:hypothetical protein